MNPIALLRQKVKAHHFGRAGLVAAGIAAAFLLFVIGAGIRLLIGPVSLGPFAGSLADAIDRALPGITVKYDQAAVEWERDEGKINLVILGTRVFDRDGRIIAQAPKADIDIGAGPFLRGKIEVRRIILVGVQLTLVRTADGGLRLGVGKDRQEEDILKRIQDALKESKGPSTLDSFAVRRARLAFYDESTKLFIVAPRADFSLRRKGSDLSSVFNAEMEISGFPARVKGDVVFPSDARPVTGHIAVTGLSLHSLAANSNAFAAVKNTALKLDLDGTFTIDGPKLVAAHFAAAGTGTFAVPDVSNGDVHVSHLAAKGHYDGIKQQVVLDEATVDADKIKTRLRGRLGFAVNPAGDVTGLSGELRIGRIGVAWPGVFAKPVDFDSVDLKGTWERATRKFLIEKLAIGGAPFSLQASGQIALVDGQSAGVDLTGTIGAMKVRDLVRYWPLGAAQGGRDWVDANMPNGTAGPVNFAIHFAPGILDQPALPPEAIAVKFPVSNAEVIYIKGLTHLTEVSGTATVTGNSFSADIASGRIGPLSIKNARFEIPNFSAAEEIGVVTGRVQGAMPDVLALVDMGNLRYPSRFGVNVASSKGEASVDLSIKIPLLKSVTVDRIGLDIRAQVTGFGLLLGKATQLSDGNVTFAITNDRLKATGTSGLGGSASRLALEWTEEFSAKNPITTRLSIKGQVDDTARATLGLKLKDYLKGPIGITGTLTGRRGALQQGNLTLDLTPAVVTLNYIGVNKPAGFPMTMRLAAGFAAESTLDTIGIRVSGPGTSINANAKFEGGHLAVLQVPSSRLGPQNDFSLTLTRNASGSDLTIRGRSLDGSRIGAQGAGGGDAKFDEPFRISAHLDRLMLRDGVAISNFALDMVGIADRTATLSMSGNLSKSAAISMSIAPQDGGRRLTVSASDMGLLLQGLYGFTSMKGGKLDIAATFPTAADQPTPANAPDFQGKATLKDFRVLKQPFLARLFTVGSLVGLANLMQGQGVEVSTLEVPFSSKNSVISVHDVRATGPAIGISADGYIDRPKNVIALKGSLVPLFGINSVLGNIPLLGTLITSKEGEGIIGMTYSVTGNTDEPSVSVNPLSALAPGILRRIFEGRMPNAANAPSNNLPPTAVPVPKPKAKPAHDGD
ncbi:AsmA-like C-terminal domain-containing protein [Rhizomicrobium electricum]|uniref:YhdP central domain-containing protein n=1 Tax=Rhizomicrobium electricum TaxID=480070 RepID=A0ABN1F8N7_9PROT|nr:hypothetical protein [Rhizomicrobium electricum]